MSDSDDPHQELRLQGRLKNVSSYRLDDVKCDLSYFAADGTFLGLDVTSEMTDAFQSYIRFRPDGVNSIAVTLGLVSWGWSGRADETGGQWTLTSSSTNGPSLTESSAFPYWEKVYPTDE